jgi:undecaprenyl-diphosphatase
LLSLIVQFDKAAFHFFNSTIKNTVLDILLAYITRLGEDLTIILVSIFLIIFGKKKEKKVSILIFVTLLIARLSVLILKRITHRPRPSFVYENVHLIGHPIFSSFPSGHTTLATAICVILCFKYARFSAIYIALTILAGISRIYVGQHYPSDVIAGFILGSCIAFTVLYLEKILQKNKAGKSA